VAADTITVVSEGPTEATVIRPPAAWPSLGLGELVRFGAICLVLARRSLMVRYRQSVIGAGWALLQPILLMLVFTVFFGLLARLPSDGLPYPVFFFCGLVIWQMVAKILNEGSVSVVANADLVGRVYFPRAYFPISIALASLVDLFFGLVALTILLIYYGIAPGISVVTVPLFIAIAWAAGLGVALWLSALNVAYRDVTQLLPFMTQLWMFASPIIYPASIVPAQFLALYYLNPIALVVTGFRWAFAGAAPPSGAAWLIGTAVTLILLVSGYVFFRKREMTFADAV
jgi:lipopolysaccharide transport system permease protein